MRQLDDAVGQFCRGVKIVGFGHFHGCELAQVLAVSVVPETFEHSSRCHIGVGLDDFNEVVQ